MRELIAILTRDENVRMQYEILLMLFALSVPALRAKSRRQLCLLWLLIIAVFCYLHRILLPVLISGIYLYFIAGISGIWVTGKPQGFLAPGRLLGARIKPWLSGGRRLFSVVTLVILLIQACRINIAVDYDSLRYGLRSDVLLQGGSGLTGFFKNPGLVNLVYTYPKGFELLTRPLYFGHTWGYILSVNLWMLALAVFLCGELAARITKASSAAPFAGCMAALIPAITNLSITAKSDLMTLVCQLGFLLCVATYLDTETPVLAGLGLGMLILSYALKPTALVFSSLTGLSALGFLLLKKRRIRMNAAGWRALLPACIFTGLVTLRTVLITGLPFTSVFTGIFLKLGMQLHYPFRAQEIASREETGTLLQGLRFYLERLLRLLLCPTGEDMQHVLMAWGGLVIIVMLLALAVYGRRMAEKLWLLEKDRELHGQTAAAQPAPASDGSAGSRRDLRTGSPADGYHFLLTVLLMVGAFSLLSLYLLYQVDGNYYMLPDALLAVLGASALSVQAAFEESALGKHLPHPITGSRHQLGLLLLCAVMIEFTALTGWAGPVGLTPIDWINRGYYHHDTEYGRFNPLRWNRDTRIVAMAFDPECYLLEGRVESFVDIDGTGGNVYLTDTKFNIFKEYLAYADIDYIYADLRYLQDEDNGRRVRAGVLFDWLLEDGDFTELVLRENSATEIFAKIDKSRIKVDWETPMTAEEKDRIRSQTAWYESIGGRTGL